MTEETLRITYDGSNYVDCFCTRWDVSDYEVTIETFLKKDDLYNIKNNVYPGATEELFKILGKPTYYDTTYNGDNTLEFEPLEEMDDLREKKLVYIKSISDSPAAARSGYLNLKLTGYISGSRL